MDNLETYREIYKSAITPLKKPVRFEYDTNLLQTLYNKFGLVKAAQILELSTATTFNRFKEAGVVMKGRGNRQEKKTKIKIIDE